MFKIAESPAVRLVGEESVGRIEEVRAHVRGVEGRDFEIVFTYVASGGGRARGVGRVDTGGAAPPHVGQSLPILVLEIGNYRRAELLDGHAGVRALVCVGLFALVWCGIVGAFAATAWLGPVSARRLLRDGEMVFGLVHRKRVQKQGRFLHHRISYRFRTKEGAARFAEDRVDLRTFDQLGEGQSVVVVYDRSNPARSALYERLDFEVVPDARASA